MLNASSGRVDVLTNVSLDFEEIIAYRIRVIASDNGDPVLSRYLAIFLLPCTPIHS